MESVSSFISLKTPQLFYTIDKLSVFVINRLNMLSSASGYDSSQRHLISVLDDGSFVISGADTDLIYFYHGAAHLLFLHQLRDVDAVGQFRLLLVQYDFHPNTSLSKSDVFGVYGFGSFLIAYMLDDGSAVFEKLYIDIDGWRFSSVSMYG